MSADQSTAVPQGYCPVHQSFVGTVCPQCSTSIAPPTPTREHWPNPDARFSDVNHAFVTGLIAAALIDNDAFRTDIDSTTPSIRVRFGHRRYELTIREMQ